MELRLKKRDHSDHYDKLLGEDLFSQAVNKKIADYWLSTGKELSPEVACMDVLAELYNKVLERELNK